MTKETGNIIIKFSLIGDTHQIKEELKSDGYSFDSRLGEGWNKNIPIDKVGIEIKKYVRSGIIQVVKAISQEDEKDVYFYMRDNLGII